MTIRSFVGRRRELAELKGILGRVQLGHDRPGQAVLMLGRRRVGKSRLVQEFLDSLDIPTFFFSADRAPSDEAILLFAAEGARSNLPGAALFAEQAPTTWDGAFRLLAAALPRDKSAVFVIDELPYLMDDQMIFEGALQRAWDRELSKLPVLFIGIGSSISMMERINSHDRPFHQRATIMRVDALNPADLAEMLNLEAVDAFDAYLVTGGMPLLAADWQLGALLSDYFRDSLTRSTSPLVVSAQLSLAAELDSDGATRTISSAIGQGQKEYSKIISAVGGDFAPATIDRRLTDLIEIGAVAKELPLSCKAATRVARYYISDPYLRFWFRFIEPYLGLIDRGRGADVAGIVNKAWTQWRGRAIEPIVREAILRMSPETLGISGMHQNVGSWWTRTNSAEVDIVIADRPKPPANQILGIGSIKWTSSPFDNHKLTELERAAIQVPGFNPTSTTLLAVSQAGFTAGLPKTVRRFTPDDLLAGWQQ